MKAYVLSVVLCASVSDATYDFGKYECNNHCATTDKYASVIGPAKVAEMSNVGVFGSYHGDLY